MSKLHSRIIEITKRISERSINSRNKYLRNIVSMEENIDTNRNAISCSNMAHAVAAAPSSDKASILMNSKPNIGIVSSYNDMLSAHKPLEHFPKVIKAAATHFGATAQVAGIVPAMCDGVTQGRPGMELSLMSRDVIAMSTAVSLSHGVYDAALCLGVCDKIVPGLLIGSLSFGHLPVIFVPAGPMSTGITNEKKNLVRKAFAKGDATREELLKAETSAYHGEGTCTFFGTANSNQMLMEIMGLHIPGSAFVHPHSDLRNAYNIVATEQAILISRKGNDIRPIGKIIDERSFVNAIVGLHATGGSTNHTLHLPAMAAAAGIRLLWEDFSDLSEITPLLARVYPNGKADVNQFHAAGGMSFIIGELLDAGLLDGTAKTVWGENLFDYVSEATLKNSQLIWTKSKPKSFDSSILKTVADPHQKNGGLKMLKGNIGKGVIKISAVSIDQQKIKAPAMVFDNQNEVKEAYDKGLLNRDVIIVVRFQGPKANGMPELHALTPILSNIQDLGFKVGLLTDGRMSGASGKVPAAIHITPEAMDKGVIGQIENGDEIEIDAISGSINLNENFSNRKLALPNDQNDQKNFGRNLFSLLRQNASDAENGAGLDLINTH
ncbi:phosphogluconate dehydratase [Alphaproteobacteria bacterium]|jgi:phosphogluconate dehydratase|nr:phosphogluconate dehydratase [Alphaproteobacteria bacterium]MDB2478092.1 phosphogluconate dehydratase [Alphaproteobacteria bacterium]